MLTLPLPFIQARNYTPANRSTIDLIVLHSMESPEKPGTARAVANWFAGTNAPPASAHYCVDDAEIIQCVLDRDVAWHAPGANWNGIGIEHAGMASQTHDEWGDIYSMLTLHKSIELCAHLCKVYMIPAHHVTVMNLRDTLNGWPVAGITTHAEVSEAFKKSNHTDPGPNFPLDWYIERVADLLGEP